MASIFSKIIAGDIPGRIIWADDSVVVFLDAFPQTYGHALVVTREEVDRWTDLPEELATHAFRVAHIVGRAQQEAFSCKRTGVIVQGYEIPHVHVHVFPTNSPADFDPARGMKEPDQAKLDEAAQLLRETLRAAGYGENVVDAA
ncbi:HIT family protein [Dermabacteraceae bacterium TAE3-ERU27]|nr:HIT family protein [Dermabacteraceae bacterium TAE3-ERU27]